MSSSANWFISLTLLILLQDVLCNYVDVEILDGFGNVRLELGSLQKFECLATGEDLNGRFVWSIGGEELPSPVILDKENDDYDPELWIQKSSIKFLVQKAHHDKKLICKYVKTLDGDRVEILNEDSLSLAVHYLKVPNSVLLGNFEEGENIRLDVEFEMFPKPEEGDVLWEIKESNGDRQMFLPTERSDYGLYSAHTLQNMGKDRFKASFDIVSADTTENRKEFYLVVGKKSEEAQGLGIRKISIDFTVVEKALISTTIVMPDSILLNTLINEENNNKDSLRVGSTHRVNSWPTERTSADTYSEDEINELRIGIVSIVIVAILITIIIFLVAYCLFCRKKEFSRVPTK